MMRRGLYHDPLLGLDNVWLENGYERVRTACGPGVSFKDLNGLHREIARAIVMSPSPMSGQAFRYLRTYLDKSQIELAALMGRDPQAVARWEKSPKVDAMADRLVRTLFRDLVSKEPMELLAILAHGTGEPKFVFRHTSDGWTLARMELGRAA